MDIWGVQSIEAEGELLATLTSALSAMGLTAEDIVVKVTPVLTFSSSDSLRADQLKEAHYLSPFCLRLALTSLFSLKLVSYFSRSAHTGLCRD
jgi:hypothetical protein